jgi:hypothetical protein
MKKILLLSFLALIFNATQAMLLEPQEIERIAEFYADKTGTFVLIFCCPIITFASLELLVRAGEKYAPPYEEVKIKTGQCVTSFCKRIKPLREEFVEAHENGIIKTLLSQPPPKQLKME